MVEDLQPRISEKIALININNYTVKEIEKLYYDFIHTKFHPPQYLVMSEQVYQLLISETKAEIAFVCMGEASAIPILIVKNQHPTFVTFV